MFARVIGHESRTPLAVLSLDMQEPERRDEALRRYCEIRGVTERLCLPLDTEDCLVQSMPDASPTKWHLGHTSWFFETFVLSNTADFRAFHPAFSVLFNSYYVAVGERWPRAHRGQLSRPTLLEVLGYRRSVDERMKKFIGEASREDLERASSVIELGMNHEQQHQELILTDVKHAFASNPLRPAYARKDTPQVSTPGSPDPLSWIEFPSGLREIGHAGRSFSFDNEGPRHAAYVNAFAIASRLTTNAEYLRFMDSGGYRRPEFWLSDGWEAKEREQWNAPLYWFREGDRWATYTLNGPQEIAADEPVCHVSHYEADAFARWSGARLPTEEEWEIAAENVEISGNFLESRAFHPRPAARSSRPLRQIFGDAWEWTQSAYLPYPGYRPAKGAIGEYNGKFMCNQIVARGGSCCTPASHIRSTYRNFFYPAARWQFFGIRLAREI